MLHALLLLAAVGSVALGIQDLVRSSSDVAAAPVSSTESPPPGAERRFVKINAGAHPAAAIAYRGPREPGGGPGQPVVLLALDAPKRHAIVRIAPADAHGRLAHAAPWQAGPVSGLIAPLPAGMTPMEGHERFPPGVTVSWLQHEYQPTLAFPIAFTAGGAVALGLLCWVLFLGRPKPREAGVAAVPEAAGARTVYLTVPPTTLKRVVLVAAAIAAVGGAFVVRRDRLGEPKVFESPLLPLAAHAAAIGLGFLYFKRTSDGADVCLGGLVRGESFVRWEDVTALTREPGSGYTLLLETKDGEAVRLELGGGAEGARQASAIAAFVRPGILAALREQILTGKEVEFGQVRLASDSVGWELSSGWRMSEFDDVEKIRVADGVMTIKLLASEFDDVVFRYQEARNGFLMPLLLAGGKHSGRSTCKMSFRAADAVVDPFLGPPLSLSGADAWIAHVERDVADLLVKQAQDHVAAARASSARGGATAALAHIDRALALFEGAGRSDPPEVRTALLAQGHVLLETKQPTPARHAYERAFRLLEADRGAAALDLGRARHGLAVARWQCKDSTGGLADARRAAELLGGAKGAPLVEVALALNSLAGLERAEGHADEAQDALEKLLQRLERSTNEELAELSPARVLAFMQNATLVLAPLDEPAALSIAYERGVDLMRRTAGEEALPVGQGLFSLGLAQLAARNAARAAETLEAALAIFEKHLGEQHAWVAGCLDKLGEAYWYSGAREQAHNAFELAAGVPGAKAANG